MQHHEDSISTERQAVRVRSTQQSDRAAVCELLSRAFWDDPTLVYFFPDESIRHAKGPDFFKLLFDWNMPLGACDVTEGFEASTMWRPPGHWRIPIHQILPKIGDALAALGVANVPRALSLLGAMQKAHPREPHWYLMDIGTDPDKQGRGYGKSVIMHRLRRIDQQGACAYLESTKLSNVPIYESWGFRRVRDIEVAPGLIYYAMWREPQTREGQRAQDEEG